MPAPERIYLDANATTPVAPEVLAAMQPYFADSFGNPSSAHAAGQRTRSAVEHARAQMAALLYCEAKSIVFTSGGTESNNLALSGVLQPFLDAGEPAHLITSQIEHHAVLYAAEALERRGVEVTYLPPGSDGIISAEAFEEALRPSTRLVSLMLANNETGAIQPVGKIARIVKRFAEANGTTVIVHTDAVQAAGKLPLNMGSGEGGGEFINVDLLSLSGHKMYAPQGTGALFVRKGVALAPLFHGGPHERGRRPGTENVAGIVALGKAAELAADWLATDAPGDQGQPTQLAVLRDTFEQRILSALPNTRVNAASARRTPNTTNIQFEGIDAESLLIVLDIAGVAASFGAACQSGATEASHVLLAMELSKAEARSSLRFSLLRTVTAEETERAADIIVAAVQRLRSLR